MEEVWVTAAVRTPIGKRGRALTEAHPAELLGGLIRGALDEIGLPADAVDQMLAGCVTQVGDQAYNIGRMAWLSAGLTADVPGTTLDAQCGSSQQAANMAAALIASGNADHIVVGGVELMSRHPLGSNVEGGLGEPMGRRYQELYEVVNQGESAERIADQWGVDRSECDEIALRSQERAAQAWASGRFDAEVRPVDLPSADGATRVRLDRDETFRTTTLESLGALEPRFRPEGRHTAGNSSQISDGAACLVLSSASAARAAGLRPLAEITHQATVGVDPVIKLTGPIPATRLLLRRSGLGPDRRRPVRGERGVRERRGGLGQGAEHPGHEGQRQRRCHRAGPPRRRDRRPVACHARARTPPTRGRARRRHDVLRRGPRHRDDALRPRRRPPRTTRVTTGEPPRTTPVTTGDGRLC